MSDAKKVATIDWRAIYQRLEEVGRAIERGGSPTPAEKKAIFRQRAKDLARETPGAEQVGEGIEVVEFLLAFERYAVESSYVREIYPLKDITPLPGTPPFVAGIVNVRSRILSVIDLKKFFDLPEKGLGDLNKIIILASGTMEFGILADFIIGNRKVQPGELQPSLPTLTGIRAEYLKGIAGGRLVVLDGGKILADKNIIIDEEAS